MAIDVKLIFSGTANERFHKIAREHGFLNGSRLPCGKVFPDLYFADQDWRKPNRKIYMKNIAKYRPFMATVLDWEEPEQLDEVLSWADEISQYVETVVIIPKIVQTIEFLPREINGKEIRLGYSVPTKHGGTTVPIAEFFGWPIHLLGGSPGKQMRLASQLRVLSTDGNMMMKMANRGLSWQPGKKRFSNGWVSILQQDGIKWPYPDANLEAFRRSCISIKTAWKNLLTSS